MASSRMLRLHWFASVITAGTPYEPDVQRRHCYVRPVAEIAGGRPLHCGLGFRPPFGWPSFKASYSWHRTCARLFQNTEEAEPVEGELGFHLEVLRRKGPRLYYKVPALCNTSSSWFQVAKISTDMVATPLTSSKLLTPAFV